MKRVLPALAVALILPTLTLAPAVAEAAPRAVSVIGTGAIDIPEPSSTFDFRVQAGGDHEAATGVLWVSHHDDTRISWAVARVDCVSRQGRTVVVTGVVGDAQDFAVAEPGDPISLSVRDGAPDLVGFGSREQVTRCHGPGPGPDRAIDHGDFLING